VLLTDPVVLENAHVRLEPLDAAHAADLDVPAEARVRLVHLGSRIGGAEIVGGSPSATPDG
jgi:hypothetical protein